MDTDLKYKKMGIKAQILTALMIFTVIIAVVLWVFQISLLSSFYKTIKFNEIKSTATYIEEHINDENLFDLATEITKNTGIDVMVTYSTGERVFSVSTVYSYFFMNLTEDVCAGVYEQTLSNGGEYVQWSVIDDSTYYAEDEQPEELIYIRTIDGDDGRLIILNARVTPVNSTVETLKIQLACVSVIMLILSLVIALYLSKKIGKPLSDINDGAKKLANGDYSVSFKQQGTREIYELTDTLNYTSQELSKVETLRKELIANVSHDLRTPLTMISGYAEVMRDIPGENSPENIQIIIDEAQRLNYLVNDLLDLSKLEDGQSKFNPQLFDFTHSIETILRRYDKLADFDFSFYHG